MSQPGGQIIGGMGGRIYTGPLGSDMDYFSGLNMLNAPNSNNSGDPGFIDVEQWAINRQWINADCTHSGMYGAIARRLVAYDWSFQASLPADQENLPDDLLEYFSDEDASFVNTALAFFLGDVKINPEAQAMQMTQRFYFAPAAMIRSCQPVLNASRDVIRYQISGEGNSRLFLCPNQNQDCNQYLNYLNSRGWLT